MQQLEATTEPILDRIHARGYWRVIVHPVRFDAHRIPTLRRCREIVGESVVRFRGTYPCWNEEKVFNGQDWIQGQCDFGDDIEFWRLYQSGQFEQHFTMREDYRSDQERGPILSVLPALFTLTETHEFAARLAFREVFNDGAEITIELIGTKGRKLWMPGERKLDEDYVCHLPKVSFARTCSARDLLSSAQELALDAAEYIFERFNWTNFPRRILREDQLDLIERRR